METKVYLTGGDHLNLALDDDLRVTRAALQGIVESTSNIIDAKIIHSVSWEELLRVPDDLLLGKQIICHLPGEPFRYLKEPRFTLALEKVGLWIAQSSEAQMQLVHMGLPVRLIPYAADSRIFRPLPSTDPKLMALRAEWKIPTDAYLIGNFHRDSEGYDLTQPKLMKGPDLFAEIVHLAHQRHPMVHVLLAGPRRHWIRKRLEELGTPYTFVGKRIDDRDDIDANTLPQEMLNQLYNLLDLYIVSSRTEGGPRSVLEAMLSKCKIISTAVGLAPDALDPSCIYHDVLQGAQLLCDDIEAKALDKVVETHYARANQLYRPEALNPLFAGLYAQVASIPTYQGRQNSAGDGAVSVTLKHRRHTSFRSYVKHQLKSNAFVHSLWRRYVRPMLAGNTKGNDARPSTKPAMSSTKPSLTVSLWHKFVPPPYGGGNQFMLALKSVLEANNVGVVENEIDRQIDAYVLNSVQFDIDQFLAVRAEQPMAIVQRVDGPISVVGGRSREEDELVYEINQKFAAVTVLQSNWCFLNTLQIGFKPVNPVIILNASDPSLFHAQGRAPYDAKRKLRLIATSWSNNPRKGGAIYKWLDQNLDWDRFEFTFVGRVSEQFEHMQILSPVASAELGEILRQHDIYVTASQKDACSNAVIEGLCCGLPTLYVDDGGHPELVGFGGLPFAGIDDILVQLDRIAGAYESFQRLIAPPSLDEVGRAYLAALQSAVERTHSLTTAP